VVDKATRNQNDRAQIMAYFRQMQESKLHQVRAVQDIILKVCESPNCDLHGNMDQVFLHLMSPMIQLLKFPHPRFDTLLCFKGLFESASVYNPFRGLTKDMILALETISSSRSTNNSTSSFKVIFQQIQEKADFADLDKGFISIILELANYVLKDPQVI
jgi:hypothetical protein